ncbi:MAG TPA: orotidine-5'-phosphate decarboxylase [Candidatus Angelobacter sp.]|nr:orotidine-5'-phosphate decarboxylase [Candidatus Angelobacter sp.]
MRYRLIVALDVPTAAAARGVVTRIGNAAGAYKVGLQLFTAEGPDFVRELVASGRKVFLDLKLHDIPNTVAHAAKAASQLGVSMLTVHAAGSREMLRAAVEAAGSTSILAVTVLTSFKQDDLHEIGIPAQLPDQVLRMASLARDCGCAGVVSSARETAMLRQSMGEGLLIVNPGIRPAGAGLDDQERVATPAAAIAAGASHIVVGRPITQADDPARAAEKIVQEMEQSQSSRPVD